MDLIILLPTIIIITTLMQTHQIVERNETVLDYARKRGHFDIVHLLEETVRKLPVTTQSTLRRPEELPVTTQSTLRPPSDLKTVCSQRLWLSFILYKINIGKN